MPTYGVGNAARITRPLRVYAVLEALVATGALLSFPLAEAAAQVAAVAAGAMARAVPPVTHPPQLNPTTASAIAPPTAP